MIFIELDPKMKAKGTLCGTKEKREINCGIFTSWSLYGNQNSCVWKLFIDTGKYFNLNPKKQDISSSI